MVRKVSISNEMGAHVAKQSNSENLKVLSASERAHITELYNSIAEPKVANLTKLWNEKLDQHLVDIIINYLSKSKKTTTIKLHDFELFYAFLARGTIDEKSDILLGMLTNFQETECLPRVHLRQYLESLIKSYVLLHTNSGWRNSSPVELNCVLETLCRDLPEDITYQQLSSWVASSPNVSEIQASILGILYKVHTTMKHRVVPLCKNENIPSILDLGSVLFLNAALPAALRNEWRILFSSTKHGESFSKMIGCIVHKGPTLLVVRDKRGFVFGGFAPQEWVLGPNYLGNDTSFLFRVKPSMHAYFSTHYNSNYQYLNIQQQTMPNGLGMGGTFGYWGLWIDAEYGIGHSSETCTTYRNCQMLSASKNFQIDHLEVWAVGPLPVVVEDTNERSILDSNPEAKAMLEMVGQHAHSDGLREPEVEDY